MCTGGASGDTSSGVYRYLISTQATSIGFPLFTAVRLHLHCTLGPFGCLHISTKGWLYPFVASYKRQ